jgi:hypothetical protein
MSERTLFLLRLAILAAVYAPIVALFIAYWR